MQQPFFSVIKFLVANVFVLDFVRCTNVVFIVAEIETYINYF